MASVTFEATDGTALRVELLNFLGITIVERLEATAVPTDLPVKTRKAGSPKAPVDPTSPPVEPIAISEFMPASDNIGELITDAALSDAAGRKAEEGLVAQRKDTHSVILEIVTKHGGPGLARIPQENRPAFLAALAAVHFS